MAGVPISKTEAKWKALLAGVESTLAAKSSLNVNGKSTTQAQMVSTLEAQIALFDTASAAKNAASVAVAALHTGMPAGVAFTKQLILALKQFFGETSPQLAQFGIPLPKPRAAQTAGQKAVANLRRSNTREARGILGKNQRAAIQPNAVSTQVTLGPDGKPVKAVAAQSAVVAAPAAPVATPTPSPAPVAALTVVPTTGVA